MSYTVPTAASFKVRYPAFTAVDDATVDYWIADAQRIVTEAWIEADYQPAIMALAAHSMLKAGVEVASSQVGAMAAKGVTQFRSGSFSVGFDASAAARRSGTGYDSTDPGAEFAVMLRRNRGGPFTVSAPVGGCCS